MAFIVTMVVPYAAKVEWLVAKRRLKISGTRHHHRLWALQLAIDSDTVRYRMSARVLACSVGQ
jgi:hypothetical protein